MGVNSSLSFLITLQGAFLFLCSSSPTGLLPSRLCFHSCLHAWRISPGSSISSRITHGTGPYPVDKVFFLYSVANQGGVQPPKAVLPLQIALKIWGSRRIPERSVGRSGWLAEAASSRCRLFRRPGSPKGVHPTHLHHRMPFQGLFEYSPSRAPAFPRAIVCPIHLSWSPSEP